MAGGDRWVEFGGGPSSRPSEEGSERQARVAALAAELTGAVPAVDSERAPEQAARWLLPNLLENEPQ